MFWAPNLGGKEEETGRRSVQLAIEKTIGKKDELEDSTELVLAEVLRLGS